MQSFVAVVEAGSFAEAARKLDLTSAAIAARIKALEMDLGVALVKRSGRSVRPTESGMRILEGTKAAIRNIRDLRAMAVDGDQPGEFRIGCFVSALTNVLPPILKSLYRKHPDACVFVTPGGSIDLCGKVVSGELDAAIVVEPQFAVPKSCLWQPFMEEPLVVVAPSHLADQDAHTLLSTQPSYGMTATSTAPSWPTAICATIRSGPSSGWKSTACLPSSRWCTKAWALR